MSQARRRLALLAAALSTCGAAALLIGAPAGADTKDVTYDCTPSGATTATPHQITVNLSGPASATAGSPYTATLVIAGASPAFTAVDAIPTGSQIQLVPQVSVSATPGTVPVPTVTATASASATASVTAGGTLAPIPTATVTVTPQAGATSMVLEARDFVLSVAQPGAAGTELYRCEVATSGSTVPAAVTAAVATATSSTSTSPSTSTTPSNTPTTSTPTPQQTHTVEVTVTEEPTNGSKVARTPEGGAATGAGGDAGPDGRMFVLVGSIMLLGAAAGGVVLRRRRLVRG